MNDYRLAPPKPALASAAALVLMLAACSGGGSTASKASATVTNGSVNVTANNTAYDVGTINAPSGAPFTIHFTNAEGVPHNIAVFPQSGDAIAKTEIITGPSATADLTVPALQPGTYPFRCDVHPQQMTGSIVVGAPAASSPAASSSAPSSSAGPS